MKRLPGGLLLALLLLAAATAGCEEEAADVPSAEPAEVADALDGLTPEQIRDQAAPMSPERAESLGIIDTTIHIESPFPDADTLLRPDTARPPTAAPRQ